MIFCSTERYIPTNNNIMVIQGDDGLYYYVHRDLYDQAVILSDLYEDKKDALYSLLDIDINDIPSCIEYFDLVVPKPINILAGFLSFVNDYNKLPDENIETLCGVLHQISSVTNFRKIIKVPKEVRSSVTFSLSIVDEYKLPWDRFFQECIPYDEEMFLSGARAYYKHIQEEFGIFIGNQVVVPSGAYIGTPAQVPLQTYEEPAEEVEEGIDVPFDWDAFEDSLDEQEEEEETKETKTAVEQKVEEVGEPPEEEETVDDGRNFLLAMATQKKKGEE